MLRYITYTDGGGEDRRVAYVIGQKDCVFCGLSRGDRTTPQWDASKILRAISDNSQCGVGTITWREIATHRGYGAIQPGQPQGHVLNIFVGPEREAEVAVTAWAPWSIPPIIAHMFQEHIGQQQ